MATTSWGQAGFLELRDFGPTGKRSRCVKKHPLSGLNPLTSSSALRRQAPRSLSSKEAMPPDTAPDEKRLIQASPISPLVTCSDVNFVAVPTYWKLPTIAAVCALETRRREDEEANTPAVRCRAYTPRKILIRCGLSDPSFGSYR